MVAPTSCLEQLLRLATIGFLIGMVVMVITRRRKSAKV